MTFPALNLHVYIIFFRIIYPLAVIHENGQTEQTWGLWNAF